MKLSIIKIFLALAGITFAIAQPNSRRTAANPEIYISISQNRREEILKIHDEAINTSDISELDDHFWENSKMVTLNAKKAVSIRLDSDVLNWFKGQGKVYQSIINNVLRTYVHHQQNKT